MVWDPAKWSTARSGKKLKSNKNKSGVHEQKQFLINSSDNESDEEWIQQLERDYGSHSQQKKKKLSSLERLLLIVLLTSLVLISFLVGSLIYSKFRQNVTLQDIKIGKFSPCNQEACVEASHRISTFVNKELNPCTDFYTFACGSWLQKTEIPQNSHVKWNTFSDVANRNHKLLKRLLDELSKKEYIGSSLTKVNEFYKSCQKRDFIEKTANNSLKKLINFVGSWSLTNRTDWNEELWNFGQVLSKIHHLKSMPLFYMYVAADDRNSTHNIIQIEQSGITLNEERFYKEDDSSEILTAYKKLLMTVPLLLGESKKEDVVQQAKEIIDFERKLASLFEKKESVKTSNDIYNKITIAQLQSLAPAIPWLDYLNSMFSEPVKASEYVIVYTPNYLKKMSDLVIKTERRIVANYMVWHLIKPILSLLSKPYRMASLELSNKLTGGKTSDDSWKNCVAKTDSMFGFATGHLFIKALQKEIGNSNTEVKEIMNHIKKEFINNIPNIKWMDERTKKYAIEKAKAMTSTIGYPDWINDITNVDAYYSKLELSKDPLRSLFNARRFYHEKTMERRGKPVLRNEWHITPTEVNVYYNGPNNNIALPSGILQSPFFDGHYPLAVNYGSLGSMIAHEVAHAFDSQGRHFDKMGNLITWWTNSTKRNFSNQSKCFERKNREAINMTSPYEDLSEQVADNGGLKYAFKAYKSHVKDNKDDKNLPALTFKSDQLFFISFAQSWCSLENSSKDKKSQIFDTVEKARVNSALKNSVEFADAFSCEKDAPMNPARKCLIW